jgi:hypothetical protein
MSIAPLLVLLTCVVASVSYFGAVTQSALATMVLPLVVVVGVLAMRLRGLVAVWTVVLVAGAGGEVVNLLSGTTQGSVARSAGLASLATGLAVVLSATRRPAFFLFPVAAIVAWALALGAGGRVELVSIVAAGFALFALAAVERDRRAFVAPPRIAPSVLLAVVLLSAAGVFAGQFQLHHDSRPTASPFRETLATTIEPPAILSLTRHPPPSATQFVPPPAPVVSHHSRLRYVVREFVWVGLGLLAGMVAVVVARLLWVALSWRQLRRRLERRVDRAEAGAWVWVLASLDRLGRPLPAHISPDVAMAAATGVTEPLRALARVVSPGVFAPASGTLASSGIWPQAHVVVHDAWSSASRIRRVRAHWQAPRRARRAH